MKASKSNKSIANFWLAVGLFSCLAVPWYAIDDGFIGLDWFGADYIFDSDYAPLFWQFVICGKFWLAPLLLPFVIASFALTKVQRGRTRAQLLILGGGLGLLWLAIQGLSIGIRGWQYETLETLLGPLSNRQFGIGVGGLLYYLSCLFLLSFGVAERKGAYGDKFIISDYFCNISGDNFYCLPNRKIVCFRIYR